MFPRYLTNIISWRSVAVLALIASLLQVSVCVYLVVFTWLQYKGLRLGQVRLG